MTRKMGRPALAARCFASSSESAQSRRYMARSWSLGRSALYFSNTCLAWGSCAVAIVHAASIAHPHTICRRAEDWRLPGLECSLAANMAIPNWEATGRSAVALASYTFRLTQLSELPLSNDASRSGASTILEPTIEKPPSDSRDVRVGHVVLFQKSDPNRVRPSQLNAHP